MDSGTRVFVDKLKDMEPVLYPIQHPRRQMHPLAGARTTRLIGKESSSPKQTQGKILYYDLIICERDGREEHKWLQSLKLF